MMKSSALKCSIKEIFNRRREKKDQDQFVLPGKEKSLVSFGKYRIAFVVFDHFVQTFKFALSNLILFIDK